MFVWVGLALATVFIYQNCGQPRYDVNSNSAESINTNSNQALAVADLEDFTVEVVVSADLWQSTASPSANGSPRFRILVDGVQIGAEQAVTAENRLSQTQTFSFSALKYGKPRTVAFEYLNDTAGVFAGDTRPPTGRNPDRNLYLKQIKFNGVAQNISSSFYDLNDRYNAKALNDRPGQELMLWDGRLIFNGGLVPGTETVAIQVTVSADLWNSVVYPSPSGAPRFRVLADGEVIGNEENVTAEELSHQTQSFTFTKDNFGIPKNIIIEYLNDTAGVMPGDVAPLPGKKDDRNLFVKSVLANTRNQIVTDSFYDLYDAYNVKSIADRPGQEAMAWGGRLVFKYK